MKYLKSFISIICAFALVACIPVFSSAENMQETSYKQYNCDIDNIKYVNSIKNQGEENRCIYYALTAAAESFAIKYFSPENVEFSTDKLFNTIGSENEYDVIIKNCIDEPLTDDDSFYSISTINTFDGYNASIKKAVYENGAAMITFGAPSISALTSNSYYSSSNGSYYSNNGDDYHHAVSIVGWDDNYPRSNFVNAPEMDGAWICQNSYGTGYGKGGFFYLSYAQNIESALSISLSFYDSEKGIYKEISPDKMEHLNFVAINSVNVINENKGNDKNKFAYANTDTGETLTCSVSKDHISGLYVVKLPANDNYHYYFDENTVVIYNGDVLDMGNTNQDSAEYEISPTGALLIAVKEKTGRCIENIKMPKYDLGFLRLVYNDGSDYFILATNAERKGINIKKYKPGESPEYTGTKELPKLGENEYYTVVTFDDTFVFSDELKINGEEGDNYIIEGNKLIIATKPFTAGISPQGFIFEAFIKSLGVLFSRLNLIINFLN